MLTIALIAPVFHLFGISVYVQKSERPADFFCLDGRLVYEVDSIGMCDYINTWRVIINCSYTAP